MKLRNKFEKDDNLRFISHLDLMRVIERAMRRAKIKFALSKGFNPHPLISFGPALMIGATTHGDYFDVILDENIVPEEFKDKMNESLPNGLTIIESYIVDDKDLLSSRIKEGEYILKVIALENTENLDSIINNFMNKNKILIEKESKSGKKIINLRPYIVDFNVIGTVGDIILLYIKLIIAEGSPGPLHVLSAFNGFANYIIDTNNIRIDRKNLILD
ncbi:TIGR03936 family radical SAM-associated protein [Thermoanaerobacterium sp. RBIITD]|uniref:TIGR03936 family radical SAM-associated protein n=1 Tax=Thermoanaerobacterium sp. RBIITD TaxID=1550240 RepID=UPI000BB8ECC5|nr:TIGR03936 family radical SAM-associated protein [Thermoanaerobacterium sp. RBIITD]SNX55156.1 radical SAM-linked protein [Thermoanaerobacterium sp. RBIITD]